jgi:hypothetical protein
MKFVCTWKISPDSRDRAIQRFKETGGAPPAGVRMVGRWHDVGGKGGWVVAEADDPAKIASWCLNWTDLLSFEVAPVVDDQEFTQLLT